jgi:hypothetical protein
MLKLKRIPGSSHSDRQRQPLIPIDCLEKLKGRFPIWRVEPVGEFELKGIRRPPNHVVFSWEI